LALGQFGQLTLAAAREKARVWLTMITAGQEAHVEAHSRSLPMPCRRAQATASCAGGFLFAAAPVHIAAHLECLVLVALASASTSTEQKGDDR